MIFIEDRPAARKYPEYMTDPVEQFLYDHEVVTSPYGDPGRQGSQRSTSVIVIARNTREVQSWVAVRRHLRELFGD